MQKSPLISILGAGSWGTALAILLARNGYPVKLWGRDAKLIEQVRQQAGNAKYLPGHLLPDNVTASADIEWVLTDSTWIVFAVASAGVASMVPAVVPHLGSTHQGVIATQKGMVADEDLFMHELFARVLEPHIPVAYLSGPSFATEVAQGLPAAVTMAATDLTLAGNAAQVFQSSLFRVYTSRDVIGVGIAGALKNVIAIATGISDGLQYGDNARAALITRGVSEIRRLAQALNADPITISGLAGLGDLILTATGGKSRNYRYGKLLAQAYSSEQAKAIIGQTVEGEMTATRVCQRSAELGVEMPICLAVKKVISKEAEISSVVDALLCRRFKEED